MSSEQPIHGFADREFRPVERMFARQLASGGGGSLCAYLDGRPVLDLWGGVRDESGAPWQRDTICVSFSTTKGVIATALHVLADRGALDYDAPVAKYWPEFAQAGKRAISVRTMLCHRAGLYDIRNLIERADYMLDWQHMVDALAAAPATPPPGRSTTYHALTWGYLVGELIRRISGREIPEFVATELAQPLGLDGLFVGGARVEVDRAARLIDSPARRQANENRPARQRSRSASRRMQRYAWRLAQGLLRTFGHPMDVQRMTDSLAPSGISRFDFSSDRVLRSCIPAANGSFTARSLARLYAALAAGGALDGARVLRSDTLARATEVQTRGFDQVTIMPMQWRLGYHGLYTLRGLNRAAFGHFGWGGSGAWADSERRLSLGYVVNTNRGSTPVGDFRITRLSTALIACADRARRRSR